MEKYLRSGTMFVVLAFILWGLTPLYYQYLSGGNLAQILIYRVFWSIPLLLAVRLLFRQRTRFHDAWKDKNLFLLHDRRTFDDCLMVIFYLCANPSSGT